MDGQSAQRQASTIGRSRAQQKRSMQFKASLLSPFFAPWPRISEEEELLVTSLLEKLCMEASFCKCGFKAVGVYGFNACVELLEAQLAEAERLKPTYFVAAAPKGRRMTTASAGSGDWGAAGGFDKSSPAVSSAHIGDVAQGKEQGKSVFYRQSEAKSDLQPTAQAREPPKGRGRLGGLICIRQSDESSFRAFGGQQILLLASLLRLPGIALRHKGEQLAKAIGIPAVSFIGLFDRPIHDVIKGDCCSTSASDSGSLLDRVEQRHCFVSGTEESLNKGCSACATHQKRLVSAAEALLEALSRVGPPQQLPFMMPQVGRPGSTGDSAEQASFSTPVLFPPRMLAIPSVYHPKEGKGGRSRRQRRLDRRERRKLERSPSLKPS